MNGFDAGDVADALNSAADFIDGDTDQPAAEEKEDEAPPEEVSKPEEETETESKKAAGPTKQVTIQDDKEEARARIGLSPTRKKAGGPTSKSAGKSKPSKTADNADDLDHPVANGTEDPPSEEKPRERKPQTKFASNNLANGKEQPRKKKLLTREQRYGRFRDRSRSPEKSPAHHGSIQEIAINDYHDSLEDIPDSQARDSPRPNRRSRTTRDRDRDPDRGTSPDRKAGRDRGMSPDRRNREYGSPDRSRRTRDRGSSPDRYNTRASSVPPRPMSPNQGRRNQGQGARSGAAGRSKHAGGHHGKQQHSFECETCLELLEQIEKLKMENTALKGKLQTSGPKSRGEEPPRGGKIPEHIALRFQMKSIGKGIYVHRVHLQDALGRVDDGNAMVRILIRALFPPEHIANGTLSALDTEGRVQLDPDVVNAIINWTMLHKQCQNSRGDLRYTIIRMLPSKRNRQYSSSREPYNRNR